MAKFNPDIQPTRDPSYLGYSRPIPQPESDKSAAYKGQSQEYLGKSEQYEGQGLEVLFKGIGDAFTSGIKTADALIRESIRNETYAKATDIKEEYTRQLESYQVPKQLVPRPTYGP